MSRIKPKYNVKKKNPTVPKDKSHKLGRNGHIRVS